MKGTLLRIVVGIAVLALFAVFTNTTFIKQFATATLGIGQTLSGPASLEDGLVLHYTFDGTDVDLASSTREIVDQSGNGNHGDWQYADTAFTGGVIGQAANFSNSTIDQFPSEILA